MSQPLSDTNARAGGQNSLLSGVARNADRWLRPLPFGLFLGALLIATFPKVIIGAEAFFFRDYGVLGYPFVFYHHECFWRGELPLWNPLSNCGAPFLAQWGTMVLYPLSLIYLLFPLPWSLGFFCLIHIFCGGFGMYVLARRWSDNAFASAVAGVAYAFGGVMLSSLIWPNYLVALGWMPWVVWLAEGGYQHGGRRLALAAVTAAFQLLAGVPEVVILTWLVIGVIWCFEVWKGDRGAKTLVCRLGLIIGVAGLLAAAQLLPFLDLLAHSQRTRHFATAKWAMPAWGFANLLVPLFHYFQTPQGQFFQMGQEFLSSYYVGSALILLGLYGLWRKKSWRLWTLGFLAFCGVLLAMGPGSFLYRWLLAGIPFVGFGRYPIKAVILTAFIVPLLAAAGIAFCDQNRSAKALRDLGLIGGLLMVATVAILWIAKSHPLRYDQWPMTFRNGLWRLAFLLAIPALILLRRRLGGLPRLGASLAVLLLVYGDLLSHLPNQNPTLPAGLFAPGVWTTVVKAPPPRVGQGRIMIRPDAEPVLLKTAVQDPAENFLGKRMAEWSNLNVLDGIPKVNGSSTLQLMHQMQFQNRLYSTNRPQSEPLLDFLGVQYITASNSVVEWQQRPSALPWMMAGQAPVFDSDTNVLDLIFAGDFKPQEVVFLTAKRRPELASSETAVANVAPGFVKAEKLTATVEASRSTWLTVAQSFYHGWRASVDGTPVPIFRANYAFQALQIPKGRHDVVLQFTQPGLYVGALLSALGAGICVLIWVFPGRQFRRRRSG